MMVRSYLHHFNRMAIILNRLAVSDFTSFSVFDGSVYDDQSVFDYYFAIPPVSHNPDAFNSLFSSI